jgi:ADP-heptose:LPS heptosyltransferase
MVLDSYASQTTHQLGRIVKFQRGSRLRRFVDLWLGGPLVFILGSLRLKRRIPDHIDVIGLFSLAAIGDTILASAIANDLKRTFPSARIIAFVGPTSSGISQIIEGFDDEVVVPTTSPFSALRIIRKYPTDVVIDICAWPRITALYAALSRARFTVGFRTDGAWRHWVYDVAIKHSANQHEVDNFRSLLQPFGISGNAWPQARAKYYPPFDDTKGDRPLVVIFHPWASGFRSNLKEWPTEGWVALARAIIADGYRIVITGSPADLERSVQLRSAIKRPDNVRTLAGQMGLADTAMEIACAAAVVSVNTGTMHLAAALNRPLVALHGPTNPLRWGPLSDAAIIVEPPSGSGCGYLNLGFEYPTNPPDCMTAITVDNVLIRLRQTLSSGHSRGQRPSY